jgi:GAF domain-containing protein
VEFQAVLDELLAETGASRVTLREDVPGETFPVTHEALSPEARSIRAVETPSMSRQPVVLEVTSGRQVVQDDCEPLFLDEAAFHEMRALYGGLRAQIVTPVVAAGEVVAILSVHQLTIPRAWRDEEVAACSRAAKRLAELVRTPG